MQFAREIRSAAAYEIARSRFLREEMERRAVAEQQRQSQAVDRARRAGLELGRREVVLPVEAEALKYLGRALAEEPARMLRQERDRIAQKVATDLVVSHVRDEARVSAVPIHEQKVTRLQFLIPEMSRCINIAG